MHLYSNAVSAKFYGQEGAHKTHQHLGLNAIFFKYKITNCPRAQCVKSHIFVQELNFDEVSQIHRI